MSGAVAPVAVFSENDGAASAMKRNRLSLAFALLLTAPAIAQTGLQTSAPAQVSAPSPEKLDLAQRLLTISDYGSFAEKTERSMLQRSAGVSVFSKAPALYEAAVRKAMAAHATDLAQVEKERVGIYARIYTDEDLRAMLAHLESPIGQSIIAKRAKHLPLTSEEIAANRAFTEGPVKAADARIKQANDQIQLISYPLEDLIYTEAVLDFCATGGPCDQEFRAVWEEQRKEVEAFRPYRGPRATEKFALALRVIKAEDFSIAHMISIAHAMAPFILPDPTARDMAIDRAVDDYRSEIVEIEEEEAQRYVMAFSDKDLRVFLGYLESPMAQSYFAKELADNFGIAKPGPDGGPPPDLTPEEESAHNAYLAYLTKIPTGSSARDEAGRKFAPLFGKILDAAKKEYCSVRPNCQQEMLERRKLQ